MVYWSGTKWTKSQVFLPCIGTTACSCHVGGVVFKTNIKYLVTPRVEDQEGNFNFGGTINFTYVEVATVEDSLVNYPNPFNPIDMPTTLRFVSASTKTMYIKIFDLGMRLVRVINIDAVDGINKIVWDGRNEQGDYVLSGTYFMMLFEEGKKPITKTINIIR